MPMRKRRALYPEDWEALATAVKAAAGWRCEQCGHPHEPAAGYTLTVHHIDGDPGHNAPENLELWPANGAHKKAEWGKPVHGAANLFHRSMCPAGAPR